MARIRPVSTMALLLLVVAGGLLVAEGSVFAQDGNETTVTIGEESELDDSLDPHFVSIENVGSSEQEIGLTLSNETSDEPVFNETRTFAPNETLSVEIYEPGNYSGVISTSSDEVAFEQPPFDCNTVQTNAEVFENGTIDAVSLSTAAECEATVVPETTTEGPDSPTMTSPTMTTEGDTTATIETVTEGPRPTTEDDSETMTEEPTTTVITEDTTAETTTSEDGGATTTGAPSDDGTDGDDGTGGEAKDTATPSDGDDGGKAKQGGNGKAKIG